ncbi:MAG: DEAD/DEAH box helicase, partial [Kiritimatiellae bacterium]|nr:DEAD/DEAH box helicase [Kiritimatiellia bacterium]
MNIVQSTSNIKTRMLRYLDVALPVKQAMNKSVADSFGRFQEGTGEYAGNGLDFIKEPYLELATAYKEADETLGDLVAEGVLARPVAEAFAKYLLDEENATPENVRLYTHQLGSLRSVHAGRNLVVCTGTGSGKTECFLLPIVNAIYKQRKEAERQGVQYDEHVRALILYPMNALVNDQVRRLRKFLKYLPDITFGRYTSETKKKQRTPNDTEAFTALWQQRQQYMFAEKGPQDEDFLQNEYRDRARWNEGGADILVTNFAMLERLLLLPGQSLFSKPWDFIVLDEAHSYSGAAGTEIAWLIRRLKNRIDPENHHDVRFLATSATLSTEGDAGRREMRTREFASSLFPAASDTFDVYSGDIESFVPQENGNGEDVPLFTGNQNVGALYRDTVSFEAKRTNHKLAKKRIDALRQIRDSNGEVRLARLVELDSGLFTHHPVVMENNIPVLGGEVKVTEGIRWLCKLMLIYAGDVPAYRFVLHDELDGHKSEIPNDNNRMGNRLSILNVWKNLANDNSNHPESIHWETVVYLYEAIESLLQPELLAEEIIENNVPIGTIQDVKITVCQEVVDRIGEKIAAYEQEEDGLQAREMEIFGAWQALLPDSNGNNYREWIYNAIAGRSEVARFFGAAANPDSITGIAGNAQIDVGTLERMINLGSLAYPAGKRRPLFDVRFHQVLRDISDVGVYFRDGNLEQPVFVHSKDEYAPTGEKIFGLGVCRRCGQPYLLGFGSTRHDGKGNDIINMQLTRFPFENAKHLHAFTLNAPVEVDDNTEDQIQGVYVNLRTGRLSRNANLAHDGVPAYWLIGHHDGKGKESFLSKCNSCGAHAVASATYGIITPYEAQGIQFKIKSLEAFAREADPDPDATIAMHSPAGGRKILSFADSRSGASSLAFSFDQTIQTTYCDELVCRLRREFIEIQNLTPAESDAKRKYEESLRKLQQTGMLQAPEEQINEMVNACYPPPPPRIPFVDNLIHDPDGNNVLEQLVRADRYERMLQMEKDGGIQVDEEIVSKLRVLKALLAGNRRVGLLPQKLIKVKSNTIESLTRNDPDYDGLFEAPFGNIPESDMKVMLQEVYSYLVCNKRIRFDDDDLKNAFYRWEPADNFKETTVHPRQWNGNNRVLKIVQKRFADHGFENVAQDTILNFCGRVWSIITGKGIAVATGNTYAFNFEQLCGDLIVERGENFPAENPPDEDRVLPFIIQEHTAQIDSKIGAVYQRVFSEGKINILSCSTTFEMGVDVGSLNNVFLGNMPPSAANYRQRAGRAGRRPGAAPWILTLCGSQSSYDRDRYDDPKRLFFGEIEPPRLYLDRPQFAARHLRAEALHSFLEWIKEQKIGSDIANEKESARKWMKISYFLLGRKTVKQDNGFVLAAVNPTCCDWLTNWSDAEKDTVDGFVAGIYRYQEDFLSNLSNGDGYSPVDDVIFQLKGVQDFFGKNGEDGFSYFRDLGGCNVPEIGPGGQLLANSRPKWRSLKDRLTWKFRLLADGGDEVLHDYPDNNDQWNDNTPLSLSQAKLLWSSTIDVLSDACVLPRYGFPVDTIQLVTDKDDGDAYGIELTRPIHLGMYEYAPGQSVYANKRRYESKAAKVFRFNNGNVGQVRYAAGTRLKFCEVCNKVFFHDEQACPCCQGETEDKYFVTPELFLAKKGTINPPKDYSPRGQRTVSWSGHVRGHAQHVAGGMSLIIAEPTERSIHYINKATRQNHNWYYLCEVPTNVVLLIPGFWNNVFEGWDSRRVANAFTSAMYTLRKAMAQVLHFNERDVGGVIQAYQNNGRNSFWFVFFDSDNGGGSGCVLDLLLHGNDDEEGFMRIHTIVERAIQEIEGCACGAEFDNALPPVSPSEYHDEEDRRPAASCYRCLRTYDNQFEHGKLDRFDALRVLRLLLD